MFANQAVVIVIVILLVSCNAFQQPLCTLRTNQALFAKRQSTASGAAVIASLIGVFGVPMTETFSTRGSVVSEFLVPSAHADVRAQQKRSYFRYIPRLTEGLTYWKNLKQEIEKENWPVAEKMFEVYVTKYNPNDPTLVDSTDFYANNRYYRPMTVLAGTFAERGSSEKQRKLLDQLDLFKGAMFKMENCFKDMKGEGLFAADIKKPTGSAKKKQALEAWDAGNKALNEYVDIFNLGLMREVNPIPKV